MPEGLSPVEAGRGLAEHAEHVEAEREERRNKSISVFEAALLALVAVLAAYSGWAAAKWSTESSLLLATASADRAQANAANLDALNSLNYDLTTFNDWFSAYVVGNRLAMADAKKRFSPNFRRAFEAWQATNPETNPAAPAGPTYMPAVPPAGQGPCRRARCPSHKGLCGRGKGRVELGRLCPYHRVPGYRPFPGWHREPFRLPGHPLRPGRCRLWDPGVRHRATGHGAEAIVLSSQISEGPTSTCCSQAKTQQFGHHRRVDRAGAKVERLRRADEEGARWRRLGPSLSDRQCGTVRGDHSDNGECVMHQLVQVPDGVERGRTASPPPWRVSKERRTGVLFLLTFMRR